MFHIRGMTYTTSFLSIWAANSDQDEKVFSPAMGYIPEGLGTQPQEVGRKVMLWATYDQNGDNERAQSAYCVSASEDGITCCTEKVRVGVRMFIRRFLPLSIRRQRICDHIFN